MNADSVVLSWTEPFTGGQGIGITRYTIQLRNKLGVFSEYPTLCDGSVTSVYTHQTCSTSMAAITATSGGLSLVLGDLIVAKVAASNSKGIGEYSELNIVGEVA